MSTEAVIDRLEKMQYTILQYKSEQTVRIYFSQFCVDVMRIIAHRYLMGSQRKKNI